MTGMFDGMASPLLVYRGATILPPLCGGRGPVVHLERRDVEHVADAGRAGDVGELAGDRGLRRAGVGHHEGAGISGASRGRPRCLVDTPLKRAMNESRSEWTALTRLMVPPERSLGSYASCAATPSSARTLKQAASPSVATTEPDAMRPLSASMARPLDRAPHPVTSRNISFESFTPQDCLRVAAPRARHGVRLPGPDRAARHRLGGRDIHKRHRPLQGLRAGPQARHVPPEALHLRRHRRP